MNRTVILTNPCKLSCSNNNLIIEQDNNKHEIYIEDISFLYIENMCISLSIPVINLLTNNNVLVVICDNKHLPSSYIISQQANVLSTERQNLQLLMSDKLKNQLWKQIISCKIENQRRVLRFNNLKFEKLKTFNDIQQEGICSKIYFQELYGKDFKRRDENIINIHLNYGYSILRSLIIKNIVTSGLNPSLSLYHCNRSNSFTLADDLIEIFRPFIDDIVYQGILNGLNTEFTSDDRKKLLSFLHKTYIFNGINHSINDIIKKFILSYIDCLNGTKRKLNLIMYEK